MALRGLRVLRRLSTRSRLFFKEIIFIQVWEFLCEERLNLSMIHSIVVDYTTQSLCPPIAGGCGVVAASYRTLVRRFSAPGDQLQQFFREVRLTHVSPESPGSDNLITRREGTQILPFSQSLNLLCSGLRQSWRSLLAFIEDVLDCLFQHLFGGQARLRCDLLTVASHGRIRRRRRRR